MTRSFPLGVDGFSFQIKERFIFTFKCVNVCVSVCGYVRVSAGVGSERKPLFPLELELQTAEWSGQALLVRTEVRFWEIVASTLNCSAIFSSP